MKLDILVVGIGGQGVMTAAEVLARAGLAAGFDACKTEVAGMSQRGGIVSSQVRIGERVHASDAATGEVDLLLALEAAEAMRWCHWLAPHGVAIVDTLRVVPPIVASGRASYPDDPVAAVRQRGRRALAVDGRGAALALGDARLANTVLLGAAADLLPFAPELLREEVLRRFAGRSGLHASNAAAFDAGRRCAGQLQPAPACA